MQCPSCQAPNEDQMKFCTSCGASLVGRRCPQGHSIPEGLSECPYCPRPVRAPTVAEGPPTGRRQKTSIASSDQLIDSGVRPSEVAPRERMGSGAPAPAPAGRDRTMFVGPDGGGPAADPSAPASPPPLVGFLVSFSQESSGQFWPVRYGRTLIGSQADCDVRMAANGVSGQHAEIKVRDNQGAPKIWLSDRNSTNGTLLNGSHVFTDRPDLGHGDQITISGLDLTVILLPSGR